MANEIRLIEASFTDQEHPGLTGEDGRMLRRYMDTSNQKWYSESDLEEAMMPYELEELKQKAVTASLPSRSLQEIR